MVEYLRCKCEHDMRVVELDTKNEKVEYQCPECGLKNILSFEESEKIAGDKYFTLEKDGSIYWKCYEHSNCSSDVGTDDEFKKDMLIPLYEHECIFCVENMEESENNNGNVICEYCNTYYWPFDGLNSFSEEENFCSLSCYIKYMYKLLEEDYEEYREFVDGEINNCLLMIENQKKDCTENYSIINKVESYINELNDIELYISENANEKLAQLVRDLRKVLNG